MKPQFITPCFVRVEDAQKRKEICKQLHEMGYSVYVSATLDTFYWICSYLMDENKYRPYILGQDLEDAPSNSINCGNNTDLFLTLASMRSDTDNGQWFVFTESIGRHKEGDFYKCPYSKIMSSMVRRATAQEIIEHFKNEPQ